MKVLVNHPLFQSETTLDDRHQHLDIELPAGADEGDLEIHAQYIGRDGNPDPAYKTMLLKERAVKDGPETPLGSESPEPEHPGPAEPEAESTEDQPDGLSERVDQSASGEQSSDPKAAGDDRAADHLTDGLAESEGDATPSQVSETRKRKRHS